MSSRYTVARSRTRTYGYAIHDAKTRYMRADDVEGIGLVVYSPPKVLPRRSGGIGISATRRSVATC